MGRPPPGLRGPGLGPRRPPTNRGPKRAIVVARQRGFEALALELEILHVRRQMKRDADAAARLDGLSKECAKRGLRRLELLARAAAGTA